MYDTAIRTTGQAVLPPAEVLISQAIDKGSPIDTLERLMALRKEVLAEKAREAFNAAMAAFQDECPVIEKTKVVRTKSGAEAYKYAPIESIVSQVKGVIQKHGFRYSTTMKLGEKTVTVFCRVVHHLGHEEVSEMEVPISEGTQIMSKSQVVAAASTFAKRYAFLNAFGIMTGDEDNDAAKQEEPQAKAAPAKETPKPAPPHPGPSTVAQQSAVLKLADALGMDVEKDICVPARFVWPLTGPQAKAVIKRLEQKKTNLSKELDARDKAAAEEVFKTETPASPTA